MNSVYNLLITLTAAFIRLGAFFNPKLKLFVNGRKHVFSTLQQKINPDDKIIWFHAASLGEFEQGLPVMESVKKEFSTYKILVTFFSPSGYEVKKNHKLPDIITYLPLDTKENAKKFISMVNPSLEIFIKYEFWPNYLLELKKRNIPVLLASGLFRSGQSFFKNYGGFMRRSLTAFDHFFLQDRESQDSVRGSA